MTPPDKTDTALDRMLADLPREIAPRNDLWRAIAQQLPDGRTRSPVSPWLAVGLVVAGVLALTVVAPRWEGRASPAAVASKGDRPVLAPVRARQIQAYCERLPLLDDVTRARVEHDLAVIRAAEDDLAQAMSTSAQAPVLSRLYESAVQQEFDLYEAIVRATEPTTTRTTT
jgi:hypothetical protein